MRSPLFVAALIAPWFLHAADARALPEGYDLDTSRAVGFHGFIDNAGQAALPLTLPAPGWALITDGDGLRCMPTAPVGTTPSSTQGPLASGSSYESLGRPDRLIAPAPGVPSSPMRLLLKVNPAYNADRFTHGLMTFDCEHGVTERRGLFFPATLAGREVLIEPDTVTHGLTLAPSLQLVSDGAQTLVYARVQDRSQHSDFPYAHPFNHLVRWPLDSDASAPEHLVSSRELVDVLLDERELAIFARQLGWSLRIQSFLPLSDGSLWFVVDLDNDRGSRDVVPRSFLFRRAPDADGGELQLIQTVTNPPITTGTTGSGPSRLAMERLVKPTDEPLLVVGTAGVASTEAPFRFTWTPPGPLLMNLIPGHDGFWAATSTPSLAPIAFDPAATDLDGDLLSYRAESELGTSDLAFDTDGDGLHDRREHLDATLDPLTPLSEPIESPPTRWGVSTRIQTAWFAKPDTAAWDTTPYFDGHTPDGGLAQSPAARYAPDGLPAQSTSGWALSETLGVSGDGWLREGATEPFVATWPSDATPLFIDEVTGPITWLGPDDTHRAAFVHIPREGRQPIFRLHPDQRLELLFDASWYGLGPVTSMLDLAEHDTTLASVGGAHGGSEDRRFIVLDAGFSPHPIELSLSPSHSRVVRFFGIGYGLADQLDPFAGGYATNWIGELVAVDDRLHPGDIVAASTSGLFLLREDLTAHRWLSPEDLLALADQTAREALLERLGWDELLHREVPPPLTLFPITDLAIADDASGLAFLGNVRMWTVSTSQGRATGLSLAAADEVLGVSFLGHEPVMLRASSGLLSVERVDGSALATVDADPTLTPWRLARLGPTDAPTWVVLFEGGKARCFGAHQGTLEEVANVVASPFSSDAAIWVRGHRVVAGPVSAFCGGSFDELVDRFSADADGGDPFATERSFWKDIATMSCRFSSGGSAAYRRETLPVETADLAVRPDGGVLVSPRSFGTRCGEPLTNPLAGTAFFLGAFHPTSSSPDTVPSHAPYRREFRGTRIGVPLTSLRPPFLGTGPMARVPGTVPADWGHVADMSHAGRPRPGPWTPPPPDPDPDPSDTDENGDNDDNGDNGDSGDDDGGCVGGGAGLTPSALLLAVVWRRLRARRPVFTARASSPRSRP